MVVGAGLYSLAVIATVCVLFVLSLLEVYEQKVNFAWATKVVRVELKGVIKSSQEYISVFEQCGMHVNDTYLKFDYSNDRTVANFVVLTRTRTDFSELFEKLRTLVAAFNGCGGDLVTGDRPGQDFIRSDGCSSNLIRSDRPRHNDAAVQLLSVFFIGQFRHGQPGCLRVDLVD